MTSSIPVLANSSGGSASQVGLKIQLASDGSGTFVPVVVLDTETAISIGAVSQEGTWVVGINGALPAGSNLIGQVTANAGANLNTSALALESGGNLAALGGTVAAGKVKVDPSGVTSPVSVASLPLPANAALETGGNLATLASAVSAGKVATTVAGSVAVTGTFWQATQPVSGTITANSGTNLNTSALALETGGNLATLAGTVATGKVKVDPSGVTSPISAASLPLPSGAATAANQATIISDLTTINTTLGTPFQAGGSVNQGTSPWIVQQSDKLTDQSDRIVSHVPLAFRTSILRGEPPHERRHRRYRNCFLPLRPRSRRRQPMAGAVRGGAWVARRGRTCRVVRGRMPSPRSAGIFLDHSSGAGGRGDRRLSGRRAIHNPRAGLRDRR